MHSPQSAFHLQLIKTELEKRKAREPGYSQRAFACSLGIDSGAMSRILAGKQPLTISLCRTIMGKLGLNPQQRRVFVRSAIEARGHDYLRRILPPQSSDPEPAPFAGFSTVVIPVDAKLIPEAERRIENFLLELRDFLESGERDCVYELAVQLFPSSQSKCAG